MKTWVDITSFSRGETDRTPRAWQYRTDDLTITLHRHIHYAPTDWLLSASGLVSIKDHLLPNGLSAEDVRAKAHELVKERLLRALKDLE